MSGPTTAENALLPVLGQLVDKCNAGQHNSHIVNRQLVKRFWFGFPGIHQPVGNVAVGKKQQERDSSHNQLLPPIFANKQQPEE